MLTLTQTFSGHSGPIHALALSPDGSILASGSRDRTVRLWDAASDDSLATLSGHRGPVQAVAFSPAGSLLASAGGDTTVRLWDLPSGEEVALLDDPQGAVEALAWSPDGLALAAGWNMWSFGHLTRWEAATRETSSTLRADHGQLVFGISYAPDGQTIAAALAGGTVRLWSAGGALLNTLRAHGEAVRYLTYAPGGGLLATGSSDRAVKVWDTETWGLAATLKGHSDAVQAVAWSPDGQTLASVGGDGLRLWEAASGREIDSAGDAGALRCVQFDVDGGRLFAAGEGGTVGVWTV